MLLRVSATARRGVSAASLRPPLRMLGAHAHPAHDDHHGHENLSPEAAAYHATHPTLFGEHHGPTVEEWEPWTWALIGGTALLVLAGLARPNTSPHDWARDEAAERLRRKAAGEEILLGVHYAGVRYMREHGVVSASEADELEAGRIAEPPAPTRLRDQHPGSGVKPLFPPPALA